MVIVLVVIITTVLALSVDWAASYIPFSFETSISRSIEKNFKTKTNKVDHYLQQLADKVSVKMNLPEDMKIYLHYVNEDTVNAMATIGGHVMIYRGLLEKLPNENALVMLLAHEIGHVKLRHPVKALGKGVVISLLMRSILGQSSDSVSNVVADTSMLTMLSFSRDQEQASDEEGMKLVNAYFGHVQEATALFEALKNINKQSPEKIPGFLSTHPNTDNRINHITELAILEHWPQQGDIKPIPDEILKKLADDKQSEVKK